jgi:iron complex outermembrane receptor protein
VVQWDTTLDGLAYVSQLGTALFGLPVPRWRSALTLDWNRGRWTGTLAQIYSSGYDDVLPLPTGSNLPIEVDGFSTWDIQGSYTGLAGWRVAAGIRNLLDEEPPFSTVNGIGYNKRVGSPLGRTYYVRAGYAWK